MMKRRMLTAILVVAATAGLISGLNGPTHKAEASSVLQHARILFAPARNFVVHTTSRETETELRCLALNVYWEARSEPVEGQMAVAAVTMNRVADARFPNDICSVVRQGGEVQRHRCQFSWWCDGKKDDPLEITAWRRAEIVARLVSAGVMTDPTHGALWYHADYVEPYWASIKEQSTKIGRHIFYTFPPAGQGNREVATR